MSARHLIVRGTVQGVFFRASTVARAEAVGARGWVRNRQDGTVEMHVEGDDEAVDQMVEWAHVGPTHATVDGVEVTDVEPAGHRGFSQR